jgi:histidine triad (HIT) family protein
MPDSKAPESPDSIFTRIIQGKIPCYKLYEDALTIAFLDVFPLSPGHTLVVPKESKAHLHELTNESAQALGAALAKVSAAIVKATGCMAYNVLQNNGKTAHQAVFHVHFHIIPKYEHTGLEIIWKPSALNEAEGLKMQSQLKTFL